MCNFSLAGTGLSWTFFFFDLCCDMCLAAWMVGSCAFDTCCRRGSSESGGTISYRFLWFQSQHFLIDHNVMFNPIRDLLISIRTLGTTAMSLVGLFIIFQYPICTPYCQLTSAYRWPLACNVVRVYVVYSSCVWWHSRLPHLPTYRQLVSEQRRTN